MANTSGDQGPAFTRTDIKLYFPVVTLPTQDNTKLLQPLKSAYTRTINWNKYQLKATIQGRNQFLHYLIDPSFQGIKRNFVLPFKTNAH